MATLAKQVADLRADVDALKGAAAAPAPAVEDGAEEDKDKKDDEEKGGEAPADAEEAPADDPPAQPETPPPPGDDDADGDGEEDKDEETTARKAAAALDRAVKLANDLFGKLEAALSENARLKAALADPAYARASMRPTDVPASGDAAALKKDAATNRRELEAEYAKIKDPAKKAAFRKEHKAELGL